MGLLDVFRKKEEKIVPDVQDADLSRIRGLIEGKKDRDPGFYESVMDIDLKVFPLDTNMVIHGIIWMRSQTSLRRRRES